MLFKIVPKFDSWDLLVLRLLKLVQLNISWNLGEP